jgi:hypothetical protein
MLRTVLAAVIGLIVGVGLGLLAAFLIQPPQEPDAGWASYPTLANTTGVVFGQQKIAAPPPHYFYFTGALWGAGFGSLVGAVVGATGAVLRALNKPTPGA